MNCAKCNARLAAEAKVCGNCGHRVLIVLAPSRTWVGEPAGQGVTCDFCGAQQTTSLRHCQVCGRELRWLKPSLAPIDGGALNSTVTDRPLRWVGRVRLLFLALAIVLNLGLFGWWPGSNSAEPAAKSLSPPQRRLKEFFVNFQNGDAVSMSRHLHASRPLSKESLTRVGQLLATGRLQLLNYQIGELKAQGSDVIVQVTGVVRVGTEKKAFTEDILLREEREGWRILLPRPEPARGGDVIRAVLGAFTNASSLAKLEQAAGMNQSALVDQ